MRKETSPPNKKKSTIIFIQIDEQNVMGYKISNTLGCFTN